MQPRQPIDSPVNGPVYDKHEQTGLLTRFVPDRLKRGALYHMLLRVTRVLQLLSSVISLVIFSQRLYKVYRLVNSIKTRRGVNGAYGAVEGILAYHSWRQQPAEAFGEFRPDQYLTFDPSWKMPSKFANPFLIISINTTR